MKQKENDVYVIPEHILQKLEELITDLQHWFLDIYSNYEIRRKDD
jgi:hypothetical protein